MVLIREVMMVFHGNEISLGIAFAVWLAWGGIGSLLGTRLNVMAGNLPFEGARDDLRKHRLTALLVAVGLMLMQPLTIVLSRVGSFHTLNRPPYSLNLTRSCPYSDTLTRPDPAAGD